MAKAKRVAKKSAPKYNPLKSNIIQMAVVLIIVAAIVLAYFVGAMR
jgi:hypothetical protein